MATKTLYDTGGDQDWVTITYAGDQAYGELYLAAPETTSSGGNSLGDVLVTDAEVSTVSSKNLVVVGGSCINSVAARLLGVSAGTCGSSWSGATNVGTGQYVIQSFNSPYSSGKVALLVAGYEAAETTAASQRLVNLPTTIDTSVGNKYVGIVGTSGSSTVTKVA